MSRLIVEGIREIYGSAAMNFISKGLDHYTLVNAEVMVTAFQDLYKRAVQEGTVKIEELPKEKKEHYWLIAKRYFDKKERQIQAAKAAYILDELIQLS